MRGLIAALLCLFLQPTAALQCAGAALPLHTAAARLLRRPPSAALYMCSGAPPPPPPPPLSHAIGTAIGKEEEIHSAAAASPPSSSSSSFGSLHVPEALAHRLCETGFSAPMPIQSDSMQRIADGENVVIHSATGSGKTLAFLVPILAKAKRGEMSAMIAVPSQELAVQCAEIATSLKADLVQTLDLPPSRIAVVEVRGKVCLSHATLAPPSRPPFITPTLSHTHPHPRP